MKLTGTIKRIGPVETFATGFQKREVILLTDEQYPQPIAIEFTQHNCELPDPFREGQRVNISINLRGREWVSPQGDIKYFFSIVGWRIEQF